MKILIVMAGFFPGEKYGGPPVSIANFCSMLKDNFCFIVTSNHDKDEINPYKDIEEKKWIKHDNYQIMYLSDKDYVEQTFESIIVNIKPDIIYLQGLFQKCIIPCLKLAKKYSIGVILAPRGELCKGAFRKKYKKIPYILFLRLTGLIKNIHYQSTSDEETRMIQKYLKVSNNNIHFLTNVPSIPNGIYNHEKKHPGTAKVIFLSRIHPKKNLVGAIKYLNQIRGQITFDIYGPIEDDEYWNVCLDEIEKLPSNIIVKYCGVVKHEEIHYVFSCYDVFLFPTYSENYGHVIAESLAVGTPVIISNQTPWLNLEKNNSGWDIDLQDSNMFAETIQKITDMEEREFKVMRNGAKEYFRKCIKLDKLYNEYMDCFRKSMKR